jgi:uncharacterized damage-inducible protein DinB
MAEDNFTLTTFYASWKEYQGHLRDTLGSLSTEQLALRAAPGLRSVGENAMHIISCRIGWYTYTMGEDGSAYNLPDESWGEAGNVPTAADLAQALDNTWRLMTDCLLHWSSADMQKTFPDDWDGKPVELSRAWIVYHVLEHDLHHGGEVSLTLGMHGIPAEFAL